MGGRDAAGGAFPTSFAGGLAGLGDRRFKQLGQIAEGDARVFGAPIGHAAVLDDDGGRRTAAGADAHVVADESAAVAKAGLTAPSAGDLVGAGVADDHHARLGGAEGLVQLLLRVGSVGEHEVSVPQRSVVGDEQAVRRQIGLDDGTRRPGESELLVESLETMRGPLR
jgi:hypothetical protein